jgi:hypothetical protein
MHAADVVLTATLIPGPVDPTVAIGGVVTSAMSTIPTASSFCSPRRRT